MEPVEAAALKALDEYGKSIERQNAERRKQREADREARRPKAYRWKDADGSWHISDQPPAESIAVEVIPL